MNSALDVPGFFKGRCVFITGGTGFMGKVLVEKLLRSCPEIATIYLLMRPKRGNDVRIRQEELIRCQVRLAHLTRTVPKTAGTSATGHKTEGCHYLNSTGLTNMMICSERVLMSNTWFDIQTRVLYTRTIRTRIPHVSIIHFIYASRYSTEFVTNVLGSHHSWL